MHLSPLDAVAIFAGTYLLGEALRHRLFRRTNARHATSRFLKHGFAAFRRYLPGDPFRGC